MNALQKFEKKNMAVFQELADISSMKKALDEREKIAKETLLIAMENNNITSIDNDVIKITYVAGTESVALDTKALRADDPTLYRELEQKYNKRTKRGAYIRFTAK